MIQFQNRCDRILPAASWLLGLAVLASVCVAKPAKDTDEIARAKLLGILVYTKVSLNLDETPAREAIKAMRDALGVAVVGRWSDDSVGFGMDPEVRISLELQDVDGLSALEQILEQAAIAEECTWQLRNGFIEVGTKERLAMPAAREVRIYHIRDFMLEPPQFGILGRAVPEPKLEKYGGVMIGTPAGTTINRDGSSERRKTPEDLALEIVEAVVETVEPGRWDTGEEDDGRSIQDYQYSGSPTNAPPASQPAATRGYPPIEWASIRLWRDQLIVRAPDFIHRQVGGYPKPIPPKPENGEESATP